MDIVLTVKLVKDDEELLCKVLQCKKEELSKKMVNFGEAGIWEYINMILGKKVFRRGADYQEFRLVRLILTHFEQKIPDEQDVSDLFQTKITESRSLIRAVLAKYHHELSNSLHITLKDVVENKIRKPSGESSDFTAIINSDYIIEELNRILTSIDGTLLSVKKNRGKVADYSISPASRSALLEHFGIKK